MTVTKSWNWKINKLGNPPVLSLQQAQTLQLLHLSLTAYDLHNINFVENNLRIIGSFLKNNRLKLWVLGNRIIRKILSIISQWLDPKLFIALIIP